MDNIAVQFSQSKKVVLSRISLFSVVLFFLLVVHHAEVKAQVFIHIYLSQTDSCGDSTFKFAMQGYKDLSDQVVLYIDYGDGTKDTVNPINSDSFYYAGLHKYTIPGHYSISIIAKGFPSGTSDSVMDQAYRSPFCGNVSGGKDLALLERGMIYPHPVSKELNILLPFAGKYNIVVYSISGEVIMDKNGFLQENESIKLDIGLLIPGFYILKVQAKEEVFVHKFNKQ